MHMLPWLSNDICPLLLFKLVISIFINYHKEQEEIFILSQTWNPKFWLFCSFLRINDNN